MLKLLIEGNELYDEENNRFINTPEISLELEHSLLSLSKWESKFQKPFLGPGEKTNQEILEYVWFMILTPNISIDIIQRLSNYDLQKIHDYMNSKESATTFGTMPETKGRGETITSELIYYWMVAFNIPFECESWHLNRLFSLIRICNIKQSKPKKMSKAEIAQRNRELNAQRKSQLGTTG